MLIIEPVHGLGNRMRALDSARPLARALGRKLTVVWPIDRAFGASFTDLFEPLDGIDAWHEFDCRTEAGRRERARFMDAAGPDVSFDVVKLHLALIGGLELASSRLTAYRVIHMPAASRLVPTEEPYADFRLKPHLRQRVEAVTSAFDRTIGVHIRRADCGPAIANSPTDAFIARMYQATGRGETQNFFVATDDPREEQALAAAFPGRIITQPKRTLDRSKREGIEDAIVDLYSLAATGRLLGSFSSTFSETAAALGGIPMENITRGDPPAPNPALVTFGITLKTVTDPAERRFRARMLSATLAAIYAQTDGAFHILVAGAAGGYLEDIDVPVDDRLEFIEVPGEPVSTLDEARGDGGRKAWNIALRHAERGGGNLMMLDMDDLVSNRLVEFVRANPHPHGYLIDRGYTLDVRLNRFVPTDDFHKRCGSSAILNLAPQEMGGRDARFSRLRSEGHYLVAENAHAEGRPLLSLPFRGAVWVINHGGNLSSLAAAQETKLMNQRRTILAAIDRIGSPSSELAAEFSVPQRYPLLADFAAEESQPSAVSPTARGPRRPNASLITFGIPLKGVNDPAEYRFRSRMLSATLASIYAQTDGGFHIIIAGAHPYDLDIPVDDRLEFLHVEIKRPRGLGEAFGEIGQKSERMAARHLERGGGHFMLVDMDDFVSNRLVEFVRANPDPNGYLVDRGYVMNARSNTVLLADRFDQMCGTSSIVNLAPGDLDGPDPHFRRLRAGGHVLVGENARASGRPLMRLPFPAAIWVLNHGNNLTWLLRAVEDKRMDGPQEMLNDIAVRGSPSSDLAAEFTVPAHYPLFDEYLAAAGRTPPPTLSAAIVTHRRPEGLRRLLAALVPQVRARSNREIVVINDGTHDDAYEAVRVEFDAVIKYRALPSNVGVAKARNAGAELASGDYLVFTDDDCEPPVWWLDWLEARLGWSPDLDVMAGPTLPLPPGRWTFFSRVQAAHGILPAPFRSANGTLFVTANVAIRRSLFWKQGGFGFPGPFHGAGEDTELAMRLRRAGASLCIDPSWSVRHEVNVGFVAACRRYWRYGYANGAMTRLTTSPQVHDSLTSYRRRHHLRKWIGQFREHRHRAKGFSNNRLMQAASAFVASLVYMAYFDGAAAALRDRDRRRASFSG